MTLFFRAQILDTTKGSTPSSLLQPSGISTPPIPLQPGLDQRLEIAIPAAVDLASLLDCNCEATKIYPIVVCVDNASLSPEAKVLQARAASALSMHRLSH